MSAVVNVGVVAVPQVGLIVGVELVVAFGVGAPPDAIELERPRSGWVAGTGCQSLPDAPHG